MYEKVSGGFIFDLGQFVNSGLRPDLTLDQLHRFPRVYDPILRSHSLKVNPDASKGTFILALLRIGRRRRTKVDIVSTRSTLATRAADVGRCPTTL